MPEISLEEAAENLAEGVERAKPYDLVEYYHELFYLEPIPSHVDAKELADHVRGGLYPAELVDLWNVVFPDDRQVRYDVDDNVIRYSKERVEYVD